MEGDRKISTASDGLGTSSSAPRIRALHGRTSGPTRRSTKGQWTAEEDEILRNAVERFKGKNWKKIAECFKDRTDVQCLHRWQKVLNPELVKGPWSKEEDEIIIELVNKYGPKKWSTIAQHLPGRIGKQCRERWHNHLNPAINKEAWTQEEELALIRAHQIYGNRWAELSKFLPGRTDNAIKNHWNSSVKKKLDSYLASGLLDQFPFSGAANQNPSIPLAMVRMQNNVDGGGSKGCTEPEDVSECSQESAKIGYSLSSSNNRGIVVSNEADQFYLSESNIGAIEQNSSPASCSERYFASIEDVTFSIPEIPSEEVYSPTFDECFSQDPGTLKPGDSQRNVQNLPHSCALELGHEATGLATHCNSGNQQVVNIFQTSMGFNVSTSNVVISSEKNDRLLITDDECCRLLFLESATDGNFLYENTMLDSNMDRSVRCKDSSHIQIAESGKASGSQSSSTNCEVLGTSGCPSFVPVPSILSSEDNMLLYVPEPSQLSCQTFGAKETSMDNCANLSDDTDHRGLQEQLYRSKDSLKLVPVNSFNSGAVLQACPTMDDKQNLHPQHDPGPLCYEPPRFPSLDMPFFSCDLVQSGSDIQQEYSPLGIRQLMMSSMNSITPFKLWDSPTCEDGPDAVLKSAAKTFTNTPSILKKRNRDLLSPLSERRIDKKLETDMANSLTEDFSRLDVMFDKSATEKGFKLSPSTKMENRIALIPAKESPGHVSNGRDADQTASLNDNLKSNDLNGGATKQGNIDNDTTAEVDKDSRQKAAGVLVEHNVNNMPLLSPEVCVKADRSFASSAWTPKCQHSKNLGSESSSLPCIVVRSPAVKTKNGETLSIIVSSGLDASMTAPFENSANSGRNENYNILGGTPFKRSIESPSAWKSPWFINSFVPGPRIDTEITIEDFGFLMSPADRSYDAIGLMKQLSEHTAAAYADALEVLGNETPESLVKQRHLSKIDSEKENSQVETCSPTASNISTERRTLDFSECGTPVKGRENGKTSTAGNLHSPSSYLLKSCR